MARLSGENLTSNPPVTRYRYVTGATKGRWCDTRREAMLAAVKAGLGSIDEVLPEPGMEPTIYLHPLVRIEER